jgi:hypothetical protein
MCHIQFKNKKLTGLSARFLCKRLQLISVKTHQMKKIQTNRYSLKHKKLIMQIGRCQFFLLKINRSFLIRDANFNMNQKNKIRRIQNF